MTLSKILKINREKNAKNYFKTDSICKPWDSNFFSFSLLYILYLNIRDRKRALYLLAHHSDTYNGQDRVKPELALGD